MNFNQLFCIHLFTLVNIEKNNKFAKCENGCNLEWGEVIEYSIKTPIT